MIPGRTTRRPRRRLGQVGVTQCPLTSAPAFDNHVLPTLFNYIIDQALQDYPGIQVGANVHVSNFAYADAILIFSRSYSEMPGLLKSINCQAADDISTYPW